MSVAVISGGAGGIATACARRLLARGDSVALLDRDEAALSAAVETLRGEGTVLPLSADLGDAATLDAAFARLAANLGPASIAVSAVAHEVHGGLDAVELRDLDDSLRLTVGGGFDFCQRAAAQMEAGGRIVLISSLHAVLPLAGAVAYNVAQGALRQLGLSLARELLERRIAVNLVEPGWIDTPGERRWKTDEELDAIGRSLPLGRLGRPDDVGAAVDFLTGGDAAYITGATIRVDGGISLSLAALPEP
jgi:glucose 1-dehydrogenase